jgi:GLPGLI family protein
MRKYNITFLLFLLIVNSTLSFAQSTFGIECRYTESYRDNLSNKRQVRQDEMVLRMNNTSSEFFSLWHRRRSEVTDSLLAKGASLDEIVQVRKKLAYPVGGQTYTIYKNYPEKGKLTQTEQFFKNSCLYEETLNIPKWELKEEQKEIIGYNCRKAQATFFGRKWTAWFTMDIPISDGPWKLCGLPGLILEAADEEGDYLFRCIEIIQLKEEASIHLPKRNYLKTSKEKYLKEYFLHYEDFQAFMNKQGMQMPQPVRGGSNPLTQKKKLNYIEKSPTP